eukprot:gene44310-55105_t
MEHAPEYGGNSPDSIALARMRYGARLQHQTNLPLLVTGGNADPARGIPPKAEAMARVLRDDFRTEVRWVEAASATTAENPRVASLMGVKPDMVISATFIIGAILAAIAGIMYASNYGTAQHTMGFLPGLKAFTAAVFGGIGNLAGAVVGGILLGLIEAIGSGYIGTLTG